MVSKSIRWMVAAVALAAAAAPASAQTARSFGWLGDLAGACWQGHDASGAAIDRQCMQMQYGRFLRIAVTRGVSFRGDSVLGWSNTRHRLEMYAWSNQAQAAIFTPTYSDGALLISSHDGRVMWRRTDTGFEIAQQTQENGAWIDHDVYTYQREGDAPSAYSASINGQRSGGTSLFGWLQQVGGCYRQANPSNPANRGCFAWQYPTVLRQTWYWGRSASTGEAVMFPVHGAAVGFYYWDAAGNMGVGRSDWDGNALITSTDESTTERRVWRRSGHSIEITTQIPDTTTTGHPWAMDHSLRLSPE
jgi:hypothetical protein